MMHIYALIKNTAPRQEGEFGNSIFIYIFKM